MSGSDSNGAITEPEQMDIGEYIEIVDKSLTNIRSFNGSALTALAFLIPASFGAFYFILEKCKSLGISYNYWVPVLLFITCLGFVISVLFSIATWWHPYGDTPGYNELGNFIYLQDVYNLAKKITQAVYLFFILSIIAFFFALILFGHDLKYW